MTVDVNRGFIRLDEGLIHYRYAGERLDDEALPIYVAHAGPGSSAGYAPLIGALGGSRFVLAPDMLGNGDSASPALDNPDIMYYADSVCRILDALETDQVDYFGSHTGAHIGVELAILRPDRIRKIIFDGIGVFDAVMRKAMLENYAPIMKPDEFGTQFTWAWHFLRDQMMHFPYCMRDPEHRMENDMPPAEFLHIHVTDVLKALTTYHKGYHAVFRHDVEQRLPLVTVPSLFMSSEMDPLHKYLDDSAARVPGAGTCLITKDAGIAGQVNAILEFFKS
jgi:pimeloyl-ACP methyl ester carboxylesterase